MKNIYNNSIKVISLFLIFGAIIFSCDKDNEVISSFDFTLEENYQDINTINCA